MGIYLFPAKKLTSVSNSLFLNLYASSFNSKDNFFPNRFKVF